MMRDNRQAISDFVRHFGATTCSMHYCGYTLYYSRGTSLIGRIQGGKIFEPELSESISKSLHDAKSGLFLDVGANIGLISLYVASRFPSQKIVGFEPGSHQYSLFKKTIAANHLGGRVTLHDIALSDKNGEQTFVTHAGKDVSKDGFMNTQRGEGAKEIKVTTKTLDSWWIDAGNPHVSVVKIDTEGAELFILRGAEEFLKQCRPIIYLEIEPRNLAHFPYKAEDIIQWLVQKNYKMEMITSDTFCAVPL